jgi:hypothetical protein
MVPMAGEELTYPPVVKLQFSFGISGPLQRLLPVCCEFWRNIGQGLLAG